ncbi:MAG: C-GCAxxG-C-C family protein [Oscillospiraceae bacterium]
MSEHSDKAVSLFKEGFNCSQSVFAAFADKFNMDKETALKVSAGLGGGVGRMREVCGAITGASLVVGMFYGATDGDDKNAKALTYKKVQEIADDFKKNNPSIICRELLGEAQMNITSIPDDRTNEYYKKRPCVKIVEDMALTIEKILF